MIGVYQPQHFRSRIEEGYRQNYMNQIQYNDLIKTIDNITKKEDRHCEQIKILFIA
jgi:hypothetical protein